MQDGLKLSVNQGAAGPGSIRISADLETGGAQLGYDGSSQQDQTERGGPRTKIAPERRPAAMKD